MEIKDLREMGQDELAQKQRDLKEQIFHLRLKRATGQLEHPMSLRQAKRDLARLETVLSERSIRGHAERAG